MHRIWYFVAFLAVTGVVFWVLVVATKVIG
jgi:hypothetical protein